MIIYERKLSLPVPQPDIWNLQPGFSTRGRRKKELIILTDNGHDGAVFFQITEDPEKAEALWEQFLASCHMDRASVSSQEQCAAELVRQLHHACNTGLIPSFENAIRYLHLDCYAQKDTAEAVAEIRGMTAEAEEDTGAVLYHRREEDIALVGISSGRNSNAGNQMAAVVNGMLRAREIYSGRICLLWPHKQILGRDDLEKIYHVQTGAVLAMDFTETAYFQRNPMYEQSLLRSLGELAYQYRKQVLTLVLVSPKMKKTLKTAEEYGVIPPVFWMESKGRQAKKQAQADIAEAAGMEQLEAMIGLSEAKRVLRQAVDYGKARKLYASRGFPPQTLGMHMVFTGNPGTAKTTVARLAARIFRENGILSKGKLIEVGRADLVGQYVGWTARQVKSLFKDAEGSVLFIDEAYSLLDDGYGQYGDEAINTIVQEMENHRQDMVVIFAGYEQPMQEFLHRNPGLSSRITFQVPFPDYSCQELIHIFRSQLELQGRAVCPEDEASICRLLEEARKQENFGNGRYVRNLVEQALLAQASRLMAQPSDSITDDQIRYLEISDFENRAEPKNQPHIQKIGFTF